MALLPIGAQVLITKNGHPLNGRVGRVVSVIPDEENPEYRVVVYEDLDMLSDKFTERELTVQRKKGYF